MIICQAGKETRHWRAAADQELGEIPADVAGERRILARQHHVKRMAVRAVDFELVEHRKGHVVFAGAELFDLRVRARLLAAKLVARKTEHDQSLVLVFLVERLQRGVLRSESAFRRDVDDKQHLALIRLERRSLPSMSLSGMS